MYRLIAIAVSIGLLRFVFLASALSPASVVVKVVLLIPLASRFNSTFWISKIVWDAKGRIFVACCGVLVGVPAKDSGQTRGIR